MNQEAQGGPTPHTQSLPLANIPQQLHVEQIGMPQPVDVDIVIPVYNEQEQLGNSVLTLMNYLKTGLSYGESFTWNIVIADNASTDYTWNIAQRLTHDFPHLIRALHLNCKGRGLALKMAWSQSQAAVQAYMDVDLSTDIRHTSQLVNLLVYRQADVAIGSRLLDQAKIKRSNKREFISCTYNQMLRAILGAQFSDAQCGFKAISRRTRDEILPSIVDNEWFFDTELLLQTQLHGLRLAEIPVNWVEDEGSTVNIADTIHKDLNGIARMYPQMVAHQKQLQAQELARQRNKVSSAGMPSGASMTSGSSMPSGPSVANNAGNPSSSNSFRTPTCSSRKVTA